MDKKIIVPDLCYWLVLFFVYEPASWDWLHSSVICCVWLSQWWTNTFHHLLRSFIHCFSNQGNAKGQTEPLGKMSGSLGFWRQQDTFGLNWLFAEEMWSLHRYIGQGWDFFCCWLVFFLFSKGDCRRVLFIFILWSYLPLPNSSLNATRWSSMQLFVICRSSVSMIWQII